MIAKVLTSKSEVEDALKLIYKVYIEEMQWMPADDNKSGYNIVGDKLVDDFTDQSTFFGVYDGDQLVATGRVIKPSAELTEISRYFETHPKLTKKSAEFNRVAISEKYFSTIAPLMILDIIFEWSFKNLDAENLVTSVSYPEPGGMLERLGFEKVSDGFQYGPTDFGSVHLFSLDITDKNKLKVSNMLNNLVETAS